MASSPAAKARTELNVAIGYVDRAARRLASEPGYLRHAHTLERLSGALADVLARADRRRPAPPRGGVLMAAGDTMKLVRDRIPGLAAANGQPGSYHQATRAEFALWLRAKLLEEASEAATASPAGLAEELGDVLQVLYALADTAGLTAAEIECARARKARTHGAYTPPPGLAARRSPGPLRPSPTP